MKLRSPTSRTATRTRILHCGCWLFLFHAASMLCVAGEVRSLRVSCVAVGPDNDANSAVDEGHEDDQLGWRFFTSRLDARQRFQATPIDAVSWRQCPDGIRDGDWLSLAQVSFGKRLDWLAMTFEGPDMVYAARRPALRQRYWITWASSRAPGPQQFNRNAALELAGDVAADWRQPKQSTARPRLHVEVAAVAKSKTQAPLDGEGFGAMLSDRRLKVRTTDLDGFQALAMAVAYNAGFTPTFAAADHSLNIELEREAHFYTAHLTFRHANETKRLRTVIDQNSIFLHLQRALRQLQHRDDGNADFFFLGPEPQQIMTISADQDLLVVKKGVDLIGYAGLGGEEKWRVKPPQADRPPAYTARQNGDRTSVFQIRPQLAPVALDTGAVSVPTTPMATPSGVDAFAQTGSFVTIVAGDRLHAYQGGKESWTFACSNRVRWGPVIVGNQVVVAYESGVVVSVDKASGNQLWQCPLHARIAGGWLAYHGRLYCGSVDGALFAINTETGKVAWQLDIGDVPLSIQRCGAQLLIASRDNTIRLLSPETGHGNTKFSTPTWLTGAVVIRDGKLVCCADRSGTINFLSGEQLAPIKTTRLMTRLTDGVFYGNLAEIGSVTTDDSLVERSPAIVVADVNGFVYRIPLP